MADKDKEIESLNKELSFDELEQVSGGEEMLCNPFTCSGAFSCGDFSCSSFKVGLEEVAE